MPNVEMEVEEFLLHQNYSREEKYNDVALLFLRAPVELGPNLGTICVRPKVDGNSGCTVHSFGLQPAGSSSFDLRLREADQTLTPFVDCQRLLRSSPKGPFFQLHPSFVCTRSEATCDLGEDRAGSPLTCPDAAAREHQLRGLVAWGVGCQSQQKPGVYTSVSDFYRWIDYHVTDHFRYIESYFGFNQV
ncbi:phenoloxidase-activating factor 2-like [Pollicipes pollicipes]|nr:phenoloxidase-activating factor 2-like [Pollicipes pollicipes]